MATRRIGTFGWAGRLGRIVDLIVFRIVFRIVDLIGRCIVSPPPARTAPRGAACTASFLVARLMPRESRTIGVALQTLHSMRRR